MDNRTDTRPPKWRTVLLVLALWVACLGLAVGGSWWYLHG